MRLERLQLSGFKSFVEPVHLDFAGGMTAIVGPNGCGKSNLADAVVWVLGERSAKTLRGRTMEDVIFGGSAGRRPLGMAEVTLTLRTDSDSSHAENGRLEIGRRIHRDGDGQYFINGKRALLKEIKDLLMDTGLGLRAYSVIEQGRIGAILSGKPQERRKLLEEAAGVTKYRERRRLSEVKLEEALANLARLDDIVAEIERSLRSLKRQAGAARRYAKHQQSYRGLLRQVLEARWGAIQDRLADLDRRLAVTGERESGLTATIHRGEADLAEAREAADRLAARVAELHSRSAELAARIEGKQEFLKGSRHRLDEIAERRAAGDAEAERRREALATLAASREALAVKSGELETERGRAASELTDEEQRISQVENLVGDAEERQESLRGRLLTSIGELNGLRQRLHREQLDREKGEMRRRHLAEELETKAGDLEAASAAAAVANTKVEQLEARAKESEVELAAAVERLHEAAALENRLETERDALEAERTGHERRLEVLAELGRAHHERREAVRRALDEAGVEGAEFLEDRIEAPAGWERSLDLYFGELADAVVLPAGADAEALAEALGSGPATVRLLELAEAAGASPEPLGGSDARLGSAVDKRSGTSAPRTGGPSGDPELDAAPPTEPEPAGGQTGSAWRVDDPAIVAPLAERVGLPAEIAAALPPAYLVDRAADARRLARRHPGIAFVSRERIWAESRLLHVQGEKAGPGILAREPERERLAAAIPPLAAAIGQLDTRLEETARALHAARGERGEIEAALAELRQELAVARARSEDLQTRRRRLEVERETVETELAEVDRELADLGERGVVSAADLERAESLHAALEAAFDEAQRAVASSRDERESARTSGASRRGRLEVIEERIEAHRQEVERVAREIEQGEAARAAWREESERLEKRAEEIRGAMKVAEGELQQALEAREATAEELLAEQQKVDERREGLVELEERIAAERATRDDVRSAISELKVERAGIAQDAEHLAGRFREEFDAAPPRAVRVGAAGSDSRPEQAADAAPPGAVGKAQGTAEGDSMHAAAAEAEAESDAEPAPSLPEMEVELERLKGMLERLGPVNLLAADEYAEQEERHAFLTAQRDDVAASVERLKKTIREINRTSTERFQATFEAVNAQFGQVFTELFRGGGAEMRLMDEDDLLESGIEIVARPPGKRLQNIMLMSGGEKALTAIALLFALFRTKPSPFCILDEVDAPLDDVNTLRFVQMLQTMSRDTQFILITHNKITMEAAARLYGVTMQEKGASNLVQVELDEIHPEPAPLVAATA